jgi:hypothetical protein
MTYLRCCGICLDEVRETPWLTVSVWIQTGYLIDTVLQCCHYSSLFSYTLYPLKKSWDKCSVLKNTNYNKLFHIGHRHQTQLLKLSVITTFLTFVAQALFHTLSSAGGSNVHKTLCIDVKSFHQWIKTERKLSALSIPSNHVWLVTCNRNNKHIIQMY